MDLLLWRPAEAEEGIDEAMRPLTARGVRQARRVAQWLRTQVSDDLRVVAAPTVAAGQMAECLGLDFDVSARLSLGGCISEVIAATGWPDGGDAVAVIAHQPTIGRLAALLLSGYEADWSIKKGALWWFSNRVRRGEAQTVLRAAIAPDLLHRHDTDMRHASSMAA